MQRNAKTHLTKPDAAEFQQRWRAIKSSWNLEVANQQFEQLCDRFAKNYSTFIAELRKKRLHYLAFLNYPENIRRSLSTTDEIDKPLSQIFFAFFTGVALLARLSSEMVVSGRIVSSGKKAFD